MSEGSEGNGLIYGGIVLVAVGFLCVGFVVVGFLFFGSSARPTHPPPKPSHPPGAFNTIFDLTDHNQRAFEWAIRMSLGKKYGELTKADLEKVTLLDLSGNQLTDVNELEKLTQLTELNLLFNPALTKAQINELQKALPNCNIKSNPTK